MRFFRPAPSPPRPPAPAPTSEMLAGALLAGPPAVPPARELRVDPGIQYRDVRHAFGLDISDASLKAVELVWQKHTTILRAHSRLDLPEGVVHRGEIRNAAALTEAVKQLLATARPRSITARHVLLAFPEANIYLHPFAFPHTLTETQVRRAIPFEAEGELPIALKEMVTDIQFHRSREKTHHVLFAAAARQLVDSYIEVLVRVGLQPVVFEVESLSLARCLIRPQADPTLLLDIGAWSSTISTVERGTVHGAVSIPLGGAMLTEMLATALGVSREEAEEHKQREGLESDARKGATVMKESLTQLVEEVRKAATYHEQHTGRPVRQLVLSGGTALLTGLVEFLAERTKLSVTVGDPLATHPITFSPQYSAADRQAFTDAKIFYTTSVGLALRGLLPEMVASGLNLLPVGIRLRYERWREHVLIAALSVCAIAAVLLSVGSLSVWAVQLFYERARVIHEAQILQESFSSSRFRDALQEAGEANAEITTLKQFDDRRTNVGKLLGELRSTLSPAVRLTSIVGTFPAEQEQASTVVLTGVAATREDFLAFEGVLRSRKDITRVDSPIANLNRPVNAPFTITLTLTSGGSPPPSRSSPSPPNVSLPTLLEE